MPIAVLSEYTEKEYEPFDPYPYFYPAMPVSVCFQILPYTHVANPQGIFYREKKETDYHFVK